MCFKRLFFKRVPSYDKILKEVDFIPLGIEYTFTERDKVMSLYREYPNNKTLFFHELYGKISSYKSQDENEYEVIKCILSNIQFYRLDRENLYKENHFLWASGMELPSFVIDELIKQMCEVAKEIVGDFNDEFIKSEVYYILSDYAPKWWDIEHC